MKNYRLAECECLDWKCGTGEERDPQIMEKASCSMNSHLCERAGHDVRYATAVFTVWP